MSSQKYVKCIIGNECIIKFCQKDNVNHHMEEWFLSTFVRAYGFINIIFQAQNFSPRNDIDM